MVGLEAWKRGGESRSADGGAEEDVVEEGENTC